MFLFPGTIDPSKLPIMPNLFKNDLEEEVLKTVKLKPALWTFYVGNILITQRKTYVESELGNFFQHIN